MMMRAKTTRARYGLSSRPCVLRATQTDNAPSTKIEFGDLISIIKAVDTSDVVEMEVKGKRFAMSVKKQEALQVAEPVYITASAAPAPAAAPAPVAAAPPPAAAPAPAAEAPATPPPESSVSGVESVAPMSGTVYRRPAPGEPLFVKEGDKVAKGQSICIIEAMKLMNEIEADIGGTVVKWVAEDAGSISPGDVICVIDPN
eukprot:jgi/Ulvmu1/2970/UM015_0010.1